MTNKVDFFSGTYTTSTAKNSYVPSFGGSVLDSLPPVIDAGPWLERPMIPTWDQLSNDDDAVVDHDDDDGSLMEHGEWHDVSNEVYEIELEQTIRGSASGSGVSGSVLRPGVVIDNPDLIQTIVKDDHEANYRREDQQSYSAFGSVEEVPIIQYSDYYPVSVFEDNETDSLLNENSNDVRDYETTNEDTQTQESSEPEFQCDLSILLGGISCSFKVLDEKSDNIAAAPLIQENNLAGDVEKETLILRDDFTKNLSSVVIISDQDPGEFQEQILEEINEPLLNGSTDSTKDNTTMVDKEVRHHVNPLTDIEKDKELLQSIIDQLILNNNTDLFLDSSNITNHSDTNNHVSPVKINNFLPATTFDKPKEKVCGLKGGRYVEDAYGKAASKYILPLLIDSWVYGKDRDENAKARQEARISGGDVTSTVLYCWVAAIINKEGDFICTGTLVAEDLVVTSGSCIN